MQAQAMKASKTSEEKKENRYMIKVMNTNREGDRSFGS
jgi:hypothetical protein